MQTNRSLSLSEIEKHTKNAGISNVLIQPSQQSFSLKGRICPEKMSIDCWTHSKRKTWSRV